MILEKYRNDYGSFDITITDESKIFSISLGGDDPNLSCRYVTYTPISEISFEIPNTEEELFPLFDKLYTNIISGNLLDGNPENEETKHQMENQRSYSWYKDIVKNDTISVLSDAYPTNCPNILKIDKSDTTITLTFIQINGPEVRLPKNPFCITINIRQSGSRIYDFCIPFKTLFRELQNIPITKETKELKKTI